MNGWCVNTIGESIWGIEMGGNASGDWIRGAVAE